MSLWLRAPWKTRLRVKLDLWWLEGVVWGEGDTAGQSRGHALLGKVFDSRSAGSDLGSCASHSLHKEYTPSKGTVSWAHDSCLREGREPRELELETAPFFHTASACKRGPHAGLRAGAGKSTDLP